jgi:hypothetical protein
MSRGYAKVRLGLILGVPSSDLSSDEILYANDVMSFGGDLWTASKQITGTVDDPKTISVRLFKRLWSNYRAFMTLWQAGYQLEADLVLRAALEAVISLHANAKLGDTFSRMVRMDLAHTLKGHIKTFRAVGDTELLRSTEADLRERLARDKTGSAPLNWDELAKAAGQPMLYVFHRTLSMRSCHVTAFSLMRGVVGIDGEDDDGERELRSLERKSHFRMMLAGMTTGMATHAELVGPEALALRGWGFNSRLSVLSEGWDLSASE